MGPADTAQLSGGAAGRRDPLSGGRHHDVPRPILKGKSDVSKLYVGKNISTSFLREFFAAEGGNWAQGQKGKGRGIEGKRNGRSFLCPWATHEEGKEKKSAWLPIGIKCLFLDESCIPIDRAGAVSLILGTDGHVCPTVPMKWPR